MYQIRTTSTFDSDLKLLDLSNADRILEKIEWLAENPKLLRSSMKYMPKDLEGLQKYRIGNWRILFWTNHQKKEIILYGVKHRRNIYKKLKRKK